jgi:hypothetical protein
MWRDASAMRAGRLPNSPLRAMTVISWQRADPESA